MNKRTTIIFILLIFALVTLVFTSLKLGSISVTYSEIFKGLFIEYNEKVASVYNIRFPRIFLCLLCGASLSISGLLFQVTLKNPIADSSLLGISSGSNLATAIILAIFPNLFFSKPLFAFGGGIIAFLLILFLNYSKNHGGIKFILTGIAVNSIFSGIVEGFTNMNSSISNVINASFTFKTWDDVKLMACYCSIPLIISLFSFKFCDILSLDDKTSKSLGFNTHLIKIILLFIAVILSSISTSVLGVIYFLGLIAPHISRSIVGSKHCILIPFSMCLGAFLLLLADTVGRTIFYPNEIPASIIMNIVGGIFFVVILRKSGRIYAN